MDLARLRSIELFQPLSDQELERVLPCLKERRAPRGAVLVVADEPGPSVYLLLEGEAKVSVAGNDGKEFLITLLEEGDLFGELAALTGEQRSANVTSLTDCHVALLTSEDFLKLLDSIPALSRSLLKILANRLRQSSAKLGELALLDVTDRVKQTLIGLAQKRVKDGVEVLVVEKRPTHNMLASMVGTSREMVTRALGMLEETNEIRIEGHSVFLTQA